MSEEELTTCKHCKGIDTCRVNIRHVPPIGAVFEKICEVCSGKEYLKIAEKDFSRVTDEEAAELEKRIYNR